MGLEEREQRRKKSVAGQIAGVEREQPTAPSLTVNIQPKGESRSRKANFLFKPSVFAQAQEKAQDMNTSLNEIVNQLLEAWVNDN